MSRYWRWDAHSLCRENQDTYQVKTKFFVRLCFTYNCLIHLIIVLMSGKASSTNACEPGLFKAVLLTLPAFTISMRCRQNMLKHDFLNTVLYCYTSSKTPGNS
jgi:hypothetical protein